MIQDPSTLAEIKTEWRRVENLRKSLKVDAMASFAMPVLGGHYPFTLAQAAQNLPFIHACSVLNEVLLALAKEGCFVCNSIFLGKLLKSGETALTWINYSLIEKVVDERNGVAHRGQLLEQEVCWKYVDAIRIELVGWSIVT